MAIFRYEATEPKSGLVQRGAMEAATAQEVLARLNERGYQSVQIQAPVQAPPPAASPDKEFKPGGVSLGFAVKPADIAFFFRQMASLLHAGFTPGSALADLAPRTQNKRISHAAGEMAREVLNGGSFAVALEKHPDVFPAHIMGLVGAGETGGFLEFACEEAALGAEADAALRQGLWVPKILFWQAIWSVVLLQPLANRLGDMFTNGLSGVFKAGHDLFFFWVPLGIALHILAEVGGLIWRQPFFTGNRDRLSLVPPVMNKLAKLRAIAAFTRMLRRLLLAGISPEPAYTAAAQAVPNSVLREQLLLGRSVLRAGMGMDAAIQATGLFEHDPLQMLITGQKTGQWTEMLDRVTAYYQEQAAKVTEEAKNAQKRLAIIVTIIATGYVTIVITVAPIKAAMQLFDTWTK